MFACWRSFYPFLNEKVFLFHCKCCVETRFSRCSSQEFAAFTVIICLVSLNMLTLLYHLLHVTRKGKSLNSSHYVTPIKLRSHRSSGAFLYVRNYFTLVYTCVFSAISKIV